MEARETKIHSLVDSSIQYVLPLFQRKYVWDKLQWETLWHDILELYQEDNAKSHFIGAMVTVPLLSMPHGVSKYLLIDGQQRLTTIFVLLTAIRDKAKAQGNDDLAGDIQDTFLVNHRKTKLDYFKLLPTEKEQDRKNFIGLIQGEIIESDNQIRKTYLYFERELRRTDVDLQQLVAIITHRLSVVSIALREDYDNPHVIFESLNFTGVRLLPSDLIRNHFFMRIHSDQQTELYERYWSPMETTLGDATLTEFIRHYLKKEGLVVKESEIYVTLKQKVKDENALQELQQLAKFATYYAKLISPNTETNTEIRKYLLRINILEVTTAYPFLLNCYDDYAEKRLSATDFVEVLRVMENFLTRRYIANVPTNQLDKIFPPLYKQIGEKPDQDFVTALKGILQHKNYPKDISFRKAIEESKIYGRGDKVKKTKLLLSIIEQSFGHKEQVALDNLTIEHILPQTVSSWWKNHLGETWEDTHDLFLHTLGNLTLTAYNSELSNESFEEKKQILQKSHLELNRYFDTKNHWREEDIKERGAHLAAICLKIWAYFGENTADTTNIRGTRPSSLVIWGIKYPVKSWADVLEQTVKSSFELAPEKIDVLIKSYPRFVNRNPSKFRRASEVASGIFVDKNFNSESIHRFCTQVIETIELTSDDWVVNFIAE